MRKNIYWFLLFSLLIGNSSFAQINKRDSMWVSEMLSRGGEFKLNDETIEAIRRGQLINSDLPAFSYPLVPGELSLEKDFDNIYNRDNMFHDLNLFHISPSEVMLYQVEPDSFLIIQSGVLIDPRALLVKRYFRIPRSNVDISISADNLFLPEIQMEDGQWEGSLNGNIRATFSAEEGLEELFDSTERNKIRNRKKANAWKYYNMNDGE